MSSPSILATVESAALQMDRERDGFFFQLKMFVLRDFWAISTKLLHALALLCRFAEIQKTMNDNPPKQS